MAKLRVSGKFVPDHRTEIAARDHGSIGSNCLRAGKPGSCENHANFTANRLRAS